MSNFQPGDRVVHLDAQPHEYDTVYQVSDIGYETPWIVTVTGDSDFASNFRAYDPEEIQ